MSQPVLTAAELVRQLAKLPPNLPVCVAERVPAQGASSDELMPITGVSIGVNAWSPQQKVAVLTKGTFTL